MKSYVFAALVGLMLCLPSPARAQQANAGNADIVSQAKEDLRRAGVQVENGACTDFEIAKLVAGRVPGAGLLLKDCCGDNSNPQRSHCEFKSPDGQTRWYAHDFVAFADGSGADVAIASGESNGPSWQINPVNPDYVGKFRSAASLGLTGQITNANPADRDYVLAQLRVFYASICVTPGPRGAGAADIEYYADNIIATGGWTTSTSKGENNVGYWSDRIKRDGGFSGCGSAGPGPTPVPVPSPAVDLTPLQNDIAALKTLVAQQRQAIDDLNRQLADAQGRLDGMATTTSEVKAASDDLVTKFGTFKLPKGCRVQFLACRLEF